MAKRSQRKPAVELHLVEDLAMARKLPSWELAGLRHATGWRAGKQVSEDEFESALELFRSRPVGGGKI